MTDICCANCSTVITKPRSKQKFCSVKCGAVKRGESGWATHSCVRCGTEFSRHKNRKPLYCSKTCLLDGIHERKLALKKPVVTVACAACSKEFETNNGHKFCSVSCSSSTTAAVMGHANKNLTKVRPCATCGVDVTVARNVPEKKVHCEEHRAFYKVRKERQCLHCQTTFMALRPTNVWCSVKCAATVSAHDRSTETKEAACRECGEIVVVVRSSDHNRILCPTHRIAARRASNARTATARYERKCADFSQRLSFMLTRFGAETQEVTSFIAEACTYSKPMRKIANEVLRAHEEKLQRTKQTVDSVRQVNALIPSLVGTCAKNPYAHFTVAGLTFDGTQQTWVLSLEHEAKGRDLQTLLLAQYLLEVKLGRRLRGDEEVSWVSGIKSDCSIENLRVLTKVTPIEYRGFWAKEQKEAS